MGCVTNDCGRIEEGVTAKIVVVIEILVAQGQATYTRWATRCSSKCGSIRSGLYGAKVTATVANDE